MKASKPRKERGRSNALPAPDKPDPCALAVVRGQNESDAQSIAHVALRPTVQAALTIRAFSGNLGELDINTLADDLRKQCSLASDGDLHRSEAILVAQAHTLNALFNSLARRANLQELLASYEAHMRLALRAQAQCRATLETLATIKNPPVLFARQANIANGPQQVNNGPIARGEKPSAPSEVLEAEHVERMDTGTAREAVAGNPSLEAVGAIHRPANG